VALDAYTAAKYAHFIGVALFLIAHGVSAGVSFRLRAERDRAKLTALLDLSASSYPVMAVGLLLVLGSAIAMAVMFEWWRALWFWAALVVFFLITGLMTPLATLRYGKLRRALGLKMPMGSKAKEADRREMNDEEVAAILNSVNPWAIAAVGFGGIAVLSGLMMFKPF
jgi:hypothetical protein